MLLHIEIMRGRTRNNMYLTTTVPSPGQSHQPSQSHSQSHWQRQQVMPPPTPLAPDARGAAAKLRNIDGYDSFANVEGLGGPPGMEEEVMEDNRRRGTWRLWGGRSRSGSFVTTSESLKKQTNPRHFVLMWISRGLISPNKLVNQCSI
jgi:hypothetical protein